MPIIFQNKDLLDLMKNFYILTGIRIVLFDEKYTEIISYPAEGTPFCSYMRQNSKFYELCCQSDKISFEKCRKTQALTMYKCHAGLIEATAPLTDNGAIIGYIMFGQITDNKNKEEFTSMLLEICKKYVETKNITDKIRKIKYRSNKQLIAASKILEACTSYILLKEMIRPTRIQLFNNIDQYISEHINEHITVGVLCKEFNISRTRLYEATKQYIDGGIAAYIRKKRLSKAKELLKTTDLPIAEIAYSVGFSDYNYFLRVFKNQFMVSPKKVRLETSLFSHAETT